MRLVTVPTAVLVLAVSPLLAACGGGDTSAAPEQDVKISATPSIQPTDAATQPSQTPTTSPAPDPKVIKVTINEDSVSPRGTRIKVKRNEPVVFEITAVKAGELHAHSTPGQELAYPAGTSRASFTFKQPGIIDVEDHRLDQLVVQLEVR